MRLPAAIGTLTRVFPSLFALRFASWIIRLLPHGDGLIYATASLFLSASPAPCLPLSVTLPALCCRLNLHWNARLEVIRKFDFNLFSFRIRLAAEQRSQLLSRSGSCRTVCLALSDTVSLSLCLFARPVYITICDELLRSEAAPFARLSFSLLLRLSLYPSLSPFDSLSLITLSLSLSLSRWVLANFCLILCAFNSFNQIIAHVLNVNIFVRFH